jgi:hypothetical protein
LKDACHVSQCPSAGLHITFIDFLAATHFVGTAAPPSQPRQQTATIPQDGEAKQQQPQVVKQQSLDAVKPTAVESVTPGSRRLEPLNNAPAHNGEQHGSTVGKHVNSVSCVELHMLWQGDDMQCCSSALCQYQCPLSQRPNAQR